MVKIISTSHKVSFADGSWLTFEMSDNGEDVELSNGGDTFYIPRDELEQFASLLTTWAAEHPAA